MKKFIIISSICTFIISLVVIGSIYIPRALLLMDINYINGFKMPGACYYERTVTIDDHLNNILIRRDNKYDTTSTLTKEEEEESIRIKRNWNVNKIGTETTHEEVKTMYILETCIYDFEGIETYPNIESIYFTETPIVRMDELIGTNNLRELSMTNTELNRISNVENIKDNNEPLNIFIQGDKMRYITQSSYDYISDPNNNVGIFLRDEFLETYATTEDGIDKFMEDSNLEIIADDSEKWKYKMGDGIKYWGDFLTRLALDAENDKRWMYLLDLDGF